MKTLIGYYIIIYDTNLKLYVKYCFLLLITLFTFNNQYLHSNSSANVIAFSNSYSLRATGTEANYWNPANLSYPLAGTGELLFFNSYFNISNNTFSIYKYNRMNGKYITDDDKKDILKRLDGGLILEADYNGSVGVAIKNYAINWRINFHTRGKLSSQYLELLLYGNEYDHSYNFGNDNNRFDLLLFYDLTYGQSLPKLNLWGSDIYSGFSLSFLHGIQIIETMQYDSEFFVSDDGIYYYQDITVRSANNGGGFKSMVGFRSDVSDAVSLSLTVDNLFGFIVWADNTEQKLYKARINNVYLFSLDQLIIERSDSTKTIDSFTTNLPLTISLGALYEYEKLSFSFDWKQGFANSVLSDKTPELGLGMEYNPFNIVPFRMGFSPGLGHNKYSVSYGVALISKQIDMSLGVRSINAVVPCSVSRGISVAMTSKWRF